MAVAVGPAKKHPSLTRSRDRAGCRC